MSRKYISTFCFFFTLFFLITAASISAQFPSQQQSYTGVLSVMWIDDFMQKSSESKYYLSTAGGETYELLIDQLPQKDLQTLIRREVIIQVPKDGEGKIQQPSNEYPLLAAASIRPLPESDAAQSSTAVTGNTRWVSIGCKFSDRLTEAHPWSYFEGMYSDTFPGLNHYWDEVSNGHVNLDGSTAYGWYILPNPYSHYFNTSGTFVTSKFRDDCLAAADADIYFPDYFGVNLIINADDLMAAYGSVGVQLTLDGETRQWATTWMTQWTHELISVFSHEMGHGYGLFHSYVNNEPGPYRNVWDVMSYDDYNCQNFFDPTYGCYGQHTNARNKSFLGWIDPYKIFLAVDGPHTLTLERSSQPGPNGYLLIEVPVGDVPGHYYTIEARKLVGYDDKLPGNAVIIHEIGIPLRMYWLVDTTGLASNKQAMWLPGETFYSINGMLSVHIDQETATGFIVTIKRGYSLATTLLFPTDDTYITKNAASSNFGMQPEINVGPSTEMRGLLKFNAQQIPDSTVSLRLRTALTESYEGLPLNTLYYTPPNYPHSSVPWTEHDLTWSNRNNELWPIWVDAKREGKWVEWDITDQRYSSYDVYEQPVFGLAYSGSADPISYSSKEGDDSPIMVADYFVEPGAATASPTPMASNTPTATSTATKTATIEPTKTATATTTKTATPTKTAAATSTKTVTPTATNTAAPSSTATSSPSPTPTAAGTPLPTFTATPSPSPTVTRTPGPPVKASITPSPGATAENTATATPSSTATAAAEKPNYKIWLPLIIKT